jgi:hypothetical protein
MPVQVENLYDPIPYRLSLKRLFYWHAFNVRRLRSVEMKNYIPQFLDIAHAIAASTDLAVLPKGVLCMNYSSSDYKRLAVRALTLFR